MSEPASSHDAPTTRPLFSWLPAHRVGSSEQQLRAESLLGQIPLFDAVPPHRLRAIFQVARRNTFSAGQTVFEEGEPGSTLHVVYSGRIDIVRQSAGDPVVLTSLGPGEFFGELALFDRGPRSATAVAAEDTETLSLDRVDILDVVNRYPEVAMALLSSVCARLRTTDNLLDSLAHATSTSTDAGR
jgi:CRP/FNR family cyclic AMP-dependent transcriptional regulator